MRSQHYWQPAFFSILLFSLPLAVAANDLKNSQEATASDLTMEERLVLHEARIAELEGLVHEQMMMIIDARNELAALRISTTKLLGLDEIETKQAVFPESVTPTPVQAPVSPLTGWDGSHAFIKSKSGDFTMQFAGRLHLDYHGYTDDGTPPSTFVMKRARLAVNGQLFQHYAYKIQADFADTDRRMLRDAYINAKFADAFQLRFGQFKSPFSQETLQSSNLINFVDRSSLAALAPGRTPGVMLHGSFLNDSVSYNIAATNSLGALISDDDGTPEVMGRLRFRPFQASNLLEHFAFGGAYGQGRRSAGFSFNGRTASRSVTFFRPVSVNGKISRANAEFEWVLPKFSIRGEFDQTNQDRSGLAAGGKDLQSVIAKGYMFDVAYVFGGETLPNTAILPSRSFLENGGMGALQFVFRYENLGIDEGTKPNRGETYTVGFNWWLTKFVRHQSNFAFERFQHSGRTGVFNGRKAFTYLSRIQLTF